MNEYFLNDLLDEAVEVMKETVHPNAGAEAIRILIRTVLEKKDSERNKFNIFLPALFASGLFGQEQVLHRCSMLSSSNISPFSLSLSLSPLSFFSPCSSSVVSLHSFMISTILWWMSLLWVTMLPQSLLLLLKLLRLMICPLLCTFLMRTTSPSQ
jgi:hypothetical protein